MCGADKQCAETLPCVAIKQQPMIDAIDAVNAGCNDGHTDSSDPIMVLENNIE